MRRVLVSGLLVVLFALSVAAAPRRKEQRVRLAVHHYTGLVEEFSRGQSQGSDTLEPDMTYFLRENEQLDIEVADPNPLLFTYKTDKGTPTPNASYAAAESFAKTLQTVVDSLKGKTGDKTQNGQRVQRQGVSLVIEQAGFTQDFFDEFVQHVDSLQTKLASAKELALRSGTSFDEALSVKKEVAGWDDLLKKLEADLATIDRADAARLTYFLSGAAAREALRKAAEEEKKAAEKKKADEAEVELQATIDAAEKKMSKAEIAAFRKERAARTAKQKAEDEKKGTMTVRSSEALSDQGSAGAPIPQSDLPTGTSQTGASDTGDSSADELPIAFEFALNREASVRAGIATARAFMAMAAQIGVPIRFESVPFSFKEDQHPFLTITKAAENANAATASKLKEGKFTFHIQPDTTVDYSVGPAVLYSLVKKDDFGTEPAEGSMQTITRKSSGDVNGLSLGAMLSITPRSWEHFDFTPSFQFGISPVTDRFGIFAGLSFRTYKLFSFGGGVAYQQTAQLDKSQHVGDVIAKPEDLKINIRPKTGFYFTVTVNLTK